MSNRERRVATATKVLLNLGIQNANVINALKTAISHRPGREFLPNQNQTTNLMNIEFAKNLIRRTKGNITANSIRATLQRNLNDNIERQKLERHIKEATEKANKYIQQSKDDLLESKRKAAYNLAKRYAAKLNKANMNLLTKKYFIGNRLEQRQQINSYFLNGQVPKLINEVAKLINKRVPPRFYTTKKDRLMKFLNLLKQYELKRPSPR